MITSRQVWDAIPSNGFIAKYVRWASKWIGSAEAFHLGSAISLVSQVFPKEFGLSSGAYPLRGNVYVLFVGPSRSSGKTEAINAALSVLDLALPGCHVEDKPASSAAVNKLITGENQLISYGEFGAFLAESWKGQAQSIRATYTGLYDCRPEGRVRREEVEGRRGRKPPHDPRWSILAGIAPGFLSIYTIPADYEAGFFARFLIIYADCAEIPRLQMAPEKEVEREGVVKALKRLIYIPKQNLDVFSTVENHIAPPQDCVGLDRDADDRFHAHLVEAHERAKKAPESAQAAIRGSKGHVLKLAMLVAWDTGAGRSGDPWRISLDDMEHAIAIDNLRTQSIVEIIESIPRDPDERNELRFLHVLESGESLPFGEIIRRAQLGKKKGEEAKNSLLVKGKIEEDPEGGHDQHHSAFFRRPRSNVIPFRREKWPDVFEEVKDSADVISIDFGGGDEKC